jgi:hypothetical protein
MRSSLACLVALLSMSGQVFSEITGVRSVETVARLTGPGAINNTLAVGVGGTDLGHMVNHDGRTYFFFGDTWAGTSWADYYCTRSNVVAFSLDADPTDGISFHGWLVGDLCGQMTWAREVIASNRYPSTTRTEIPSAAVSVGNRIYAYYSSIQEWGIPGDWTVNYTGLAWWEFGDPAFTIVPTFEIPPNSNFCQVAASYRDDLPAGQDEYLYIWGTPPGRFHSVKLARVLPASIEDLSAYRYFGGLDAFGNPIWLANELLSPVIVPAPVGELSVMYNRAAEVWTMMYFNVATNAVELRQAHHPWGLWSAPIRVTDAAQYPGLYAPYMNPRYVEGDGRTVYFTMSLWDDYDVFLLKADLDIHTAPNGCGLGVGLPVLASCWAICLGWLTTLRVRLRRTRRAES